MELHNVDIIIPLNCDANPQVTRVDGSHTHNKREGTLVWHLDMIDMNNPSGSIEFSIAQPDEDAFFPINIAFMSESTYASVLVPEVQSSQDGSLVRHSFSSTLSVGKYIVQ
jgi:hypothetical protein